MVTNNEKRELKILPLVNGKTAEIRIMLSDLPGSLAKVVNIISKHKIDILMSTSQRVDKGKLAEWSAMVDTTSCRDLKGMENHLKSTGVVKKVVVEKK